MLTHRRNFGKTEALVTAAAATQARWLVLYDADLQHRPSEIARFLQKLDEGWDIVTGRKVGPYEKRAFSSIYNRLSQRVFSVPVSDINSMKAFRRDILEEVALRHDWHRFFVVLAVARVRTSTCTIRSTGAAALPARSGIHVAAPEPHSRLRPRRNRPAHGQDPQGARCRRQERYHHDLWLQEMTAGWCAVCS